jgi:transglutaminase-like putative cysteine protease
MEMILKRDTDDLVAYLIDSDIIDYHDQNVKEMAEKLKSQYGQGISLVKGIFEFVRDEIAHSIDIGGKNVTCTASEVLTYREGFCYAKSHLMAALLRYNGFPTGFCYQRLLLDDETAPYLILHGLNAVYLKDSDRWIRLDARGNKANVNAQFSTESEILAFPVRTAVGEADIPVIFHEPDAKVIAKLQSHHSVEALLADLPRKLACE